MYSLGVAYTSLSLARSSTYLRSASVNWTLRQLLKVWPNRCQPRLATPDDVLPRYETRLQPGAMEK